MNLTEALTEIKGRIKPYIHVGMPQSTFANTIRAIENGLAKPATVKSFMARFGYEKINQEESWMQKN